MPTGSVISFAGAAAPADWLLCDGTIYLNVTYPTLAALLGTTYGGVLGTSFGVPDARGRVLVGAGTGAGLTPRALAATGGEENHVLTTPELASHGHGVTDPGHTHLTSSAGPLLTSVGTGAVSGLPLPGFFTIVETANFTGLTVNPAGGGLGHNTMQPFLVQNAIIKT